MKRTKFRMRFGSHLPVLMKLLEITFGPVLELGSGLYSTPFLHWACYRTSRPLFTYENHQVYFDNAKQYERDFHKVELVTNWDAINVSLPWSVVLIDHDPLERRPIETMRCRHADYIVFHDANDRAKYRHDYKGLFNSFKYRKLFDQVGAASMILSDFHNLERFSIK